MNALEMLRVAVRALLRNKLRSFLTALGIIIGVGAVITMVAIGEGAKAQVQQAFASMGSNLLVLLPGSTASGGVSGGFGSQPTLTYGDLDSIKAQVQGIRGISATLRKNGQVVAEDQNWSTSIYGVSADYFVIRDWPMAHGSAFTDTDDQGATKVAVLGQTVVTNLFGAGADPTGQVVRIAGTPFQVAGVAASKGQSASGQDNDDAVFIPVSTYRTKIQGGVGDYVHGMVMIGAQSSDDIQPVIDGITSILRERHHLRADEANDFDIRNLTEMAAATEASKNTIATLLASIAAVSLVVGGIGIMNIMLVSVTERTREIGVRMAVGAKPAHVLWQFLVEATALSLAGGIIGVLSGIVVAQRLAASFQWPLLIRPDIVAVSLGVSAAVGIVFGVYPARKASRLDPIEALRYE